MTVNFQDYYATLGVTREATPEEIKRAYRALARKHHPDKATPGARPAAEARIKEINEAYAVLKDPAKRKKYDRLGKNREQPERAGGGFAAHFGGTGFSDFFEQFFGSGGEFATGDPAAASRSAFRSHRAPPEEAAVESDIMVPLEEAARGATREISLRSVDPLTSQSRIQQLKVTIPAGVREGQRLRIPRAGGAPGKIHLVVRLAPHPDFRVQGGDLYHELELAPWEAVLGAKVEVPTLNGSVRLTIPPGTPQGRQFRVRGRGLPALRDGQPGDLFVETIVQLPESTSPQERAAWAELARISGFKPRG